MPAKAEIRSHAYSNRLHLGQSRPWVSGQNRTVMRLLTTV